MALILNIDTATENAGICIARDGISLGMLTNTSQKDHAAWIQTAIQDLLQSCGTSIHALDAIAVADGPGSYTGLRVAMATAKGLCYALQIPLITEHTLIVMATAAKTQHAGLLSEKQALLCPMIDARRMEVFTAVYSTELEALVPPTAMILDSDSFAEQLCRHTVLFFGNGAEKFRTVLPHPAAVFVPVDAGANVLSRCSYQKWLQQNFADLSYAEPFYLKNFHNPSKK